jgi:surface antigen
LETLEMRKHVTATVLLAASLMTAGCEGGTKQILGTLSGAAAGGWAGAQFGGGSGKLATTALGALIGAFGGGEIGKSLDKADAVYAGQALGSAYTAPVGEEIAWGNPDTGNHGTVTPVRNVRTATGQYCRDFDQTIYIGGQARKANGRACLQPDGSWRISQ